MTDDIVARLREDFVEQIADEQPYMVAETYKKERHEAADEIERLRAALDVYACICPEGLCCEEPCGYIARAALEGEKDNGND